jgi:predicted metalloprotease
MDDPPVDSPREEGKPGNSPVSIGLALVAVLGVVLGIGLVGRTVEPRRVAGTARVDPSVATGLRGSSPPRTAQPLGDNPLLAGGIAATPVACALPLFGRSDDQLAAYYEAALRCLNDVWTPVLQAANIPFRAPKLRVTAELPASACGDAPDVDTVAYYCGRDETIYMSTRRGLADGGGSQPPTHLATLSHEYGHHVQLLSGMLTAASQRIVAAGERSPVGLELTRRIELQANCFAGVFLFATAGQGSISRSLARRADQDFHEAVPEPAEQNTHGSPNNQGEWADRGYESGRTVDCNTWTAGPDVVR